jgi:predicted ATP-grasp superfamily ATP-dependent carboligase
VLVIDGFADRQTVALAHKAVVADFDASGFKAGDLLIKLQELISGLLPNSGMPSELVGFLYGSGFEAQPALLDKIAHHVPLIGNYPSVVKAVKGAGSFFSSLKNLAILHPKVLLTPPLQSELGQFLYKMEGGSGGAHVMPASGKELLNAGNGYYQQWIEGLPVSLLFLADGSNIRAVGFNELLISPSPEAPFRYGGVVREAPISHDVQQQLMQTAKKLTAQFGLRGLNSLDAMVAKPSGQDQVKAERQQLYVLEVNPRLSATLDLYEALKPKLIEQHILLCKKLAVLDSCDTITKFAYSETYQGQAIVYADAVISYDAKLAWPVWVKDNPPAQGVVHVQKGEPICSVVASGVSLQEVKHRLQNRMQRVKCLLQDNSGNSSI